MEICCFCVEIESNRCHCWTLEKNLGREKNATVRGKNNNNINDDDDDDDNFLLIVAQIQVKATRVYEQNS